MINKKLGFYLVDNLEFDSKIQACIHAHRSGKDVEWIFNDDKFSTYDWTREPDATLDQLYDRRAKEIREKYDYVILSYSGGADSHNIAQSFLRQNLLIDEIVVNSMSAASEKYTINHADVKNAENAAAEHCLQTLPRLTEIKNQFPKIKITILDLTDYLMNSWLAAGDASWIADKKEGLNPLNVTRFNYLHFDDIRKKFDKDKKIALVLGIEKPRTFIHKDNKFYLRFVDRATNIVTIENHIKEYPNAVVEYFYWSPDSLDLLCKQAHTIKKWLEIYPQYQNAWNSDRFTATTFRLVHERLLRKIIYTTWNDEWYQADKATKDWYSEFDSWFIEGFKGTKQHNIWLEGIKYVESNAGKFLNKSQGYADGLISFNKNYYIGDIKKNDIKI